MHAIVSAVAIVLLAVLGAHAKRDKLFVQNAFVIEFDRSQSTSLLQRRSAMYDQLNFHNISHHIRHEYDFMDAISVAFDTADDAARFFEQAKGIKKVWPVNSVSKPNAAVVPVRQDIVSSLFELYNVTGVHRVRNELGITGKGIKVGIIDTGIDYMHPALGGCFGPNCRVAYGYDFVGDEYDGESVPNPDNDPRDTCNGHGTHVTGIIGAKDNDMHFEGIAPEVTFGAYRIFGCSGSSADDVIMKAMEKAYLDGMDVINLSLGDVGWPDSPASVLADQLALRGMAVCAAAGNEGDKGAFEVGAPSLGRHAISIASVDNTRMLAHAIRAGDIDIGYTTWTSNPFTLTDAEIVPISDTFGKDRDGCDEIQADLTGKVAFIGRGGCFFDEKILKAQSAGAIGVLVYNNIPGMITPSTTSPAIRIEHGGISQEDGRKLFDYIHANPAAKIEFQPEDLSFPLSTAGTISPFSSWGLGPDLSIKPDISAPGGQIYSTYPLALGGYATLSGTSMASPHIAGIVALLQQARGGSRSIGTDELRTLLINNGHPIKLYGSDSLDSVARQGSGLVDIYQAIRASTAIYPEQLRLSDEPHAASNNEYTFAIKNNDRMSAEYRISHKSATTAQAYQRNTVAFTPLDVPKLLTNHEVEAVVEIMEPVVTVAANEQRNVTVRILPPRNSDQVPPSIYSGYLVIEKNDDPGQTLHLPYAGLTSSLASLPVLQVNQTMPFILNRQASKQAPALLTFQLAVASPLLQVKVVQANNPATELGLIPGGYFSFVGRNNMNDAQDTIMLPWFGAVANNTEQAAGKARIDPTKFRPSVFLDADSIKLDLLSRIGTPLPRGTYKLKVSALRPFGDEKNEADYDIWLSPEISL